MGASSCVWLGGDVGVGAHRVDGRSPGAVMSGWAHGARHRWLNLGYPNIARTVLQGDSWILGGEGGGVCWMDVAQA